MRRNERKLLILEALTNYSAPVSAGTLWAKHFKNGPYRTSWDAIRKRLEGYTVWNLVERTRSRVHPYEWYYKLSEKGKSRLAFLKRKHAI